MIYLDNGATTFCRPAPVRRAMARALRTCASPGRGGYGPAEEAAARVYGCREQAAALFHCEPEQAVITGSCTQGLNMAIRSLVSPGDRVVISGFEHNAVVRPLYGLGAEIVVAGRKLFDWEDTLRSFDRTLTGDTKAAVFTQVSNVFGYILPVKQLGQMCRDRGIPFILDCAQSAGTMDLDFEDLGPAYMAMPGHKGLLGPQGTGLLLCREPGRPLIYGGTGTLSRDREMPEFLPERLEPGTANVPGIAGLEAALRTLKKLEPERIGRRERELRALAQQGLRELGAQVYAGPHQAGTLSFRLPGDCEYLAGLLAERGICLRAGLHCAPLAHESAFTVDTGTIRMSPGWNTGKREIMGFLKAVSKLPTRQV